MLTVSISERGGLLQGRLNDDSHFGERMIERQPVADDHPHADANRRGVRVA